MARQIAPRMHGTGVENLRKGTAGPFDSRRGSIHSEHNLLDPDAVKASLAKKIGDRLT